jgi:hypothetical protein
MPYQVQRMTGAAASGGIHDPLAVIYEATHHRLLRENLTPP